MPGSSQVRPWAGVTCPAVVRQQPRWNCLSWTLTPFSNGGVRSKVVQIRLSWMLPLVLSSPIFDHCRLLADLLPTIRNHAGTCISPQAKPVRRYKPHLCSSPTLLLALLVCPLFLVRCSGARHLAHDPASTLCAPPSVPHYFIRLALQP